MNTKKKFAALALAAAISVSASGCADQSWSYKTDSVTLTAGAYIFNLLNGYYEAADLIESPDEVKDKLSAEVRKESDDELKTVEQYTYDYADDAALKMLAVETLFDKYGLTLDETEDEAAHSYADQVWSTAKKTLEGYGISEESFTYCYADYNVKSGQVFEYLYGEKGEKYVKDEEIVDYFKNNFTGYAYFSVYMYETDEDGNSVAKSDEEFEKTKNDLEGYADLINKDGKTYYDAVNAYIKDYSSEIDPTYSGSFKNDSFATGLDNDTSKMLVNMKEGEAKVVMTGEGASAIYYLIYKPAYDDIEDYLDPTVESPEYKSTPNADGIEIYNLKSGETHYSLLNDMKKDDYDKYLVEYGKSLNPKRNDAALKKYKAKMFITDDSDSE